MLWTGCGRAGVGVSTVYISFLLCGVFEQDVETAMGNNNSFIVTFIRQCVTEWRWDEAGRWWWW